MVTGFTPDISDLLDFEFWTLVWFYPHKHPSITDDARQLGRWMGSARNVGTSLTYWIMTVSGKPVTDDSVQHVTAEDLRNDAIKAQVDKFDAALTARLDDENFTLSGPFDGRHGSLDDIDIGNMPVDSAHGDGTTTPSAEEYGNHPGIADIDDVHGADVYLNATVRMEDTQEGKVNLATVVGRHRDPMTGTAKGKAHDNPLLDTKEYVLELSDGTTEVYLAKVMEKIGEHFTLKDGFSEPDTFLGAGLTKKSFTTEGGAKSLWTMDSAKYVANAVKTVESLLAEDGRELKGCSPPPCLRRTGPLALRARSATVVRARPGPVLVLPRRPTPPSSSPTEDREVVDDNGDAIQLTDQDCTRIFHAKVTRSDNSNQRCLSTSEDRKGNQWPTMEKQLQTYYQNDCAKLKVWRDGVQLTSMFANVDGALRSLYFNALTGERLSILVQSSRSLKHGSAFPDHKRYGVHESRVARVCGGIHPNSWQMNMSNSWMIPTLPDQEKAMLRWAEPLEGRALVLSNGSTARVTLAKEGETRFMRDEEARRIANKKERDGEAARKMEEREG